MRKFGISLLILEAFIFLVFSTWWMRICYPLKVLSSILKANIIYREKLPLSIVSFSFTEPSLAHNVVSSVSPTDAVFETSEMMSR